MLRTRAITSRRMQALFKRSSSVSVCFGDRDSRFNRPAGTSNPEGCKSVETSGAEPAGASRGSCIWSCIEQIE